jgi:hypothetical protein
MAKVFDMGRGLLDFFTRQRRTEALERLKRPPVRKAVYLYRDECGATFTSIARPGPMKHSMCIGSAYVVEGQFIDKL